MSEKKLFQDKRWIQNPGGVVVGKSKISEESKKWAEELIKQIEKEEKLQNECKEKVEKNNAEIERLDNENIKINQELAQNRANQILQNKVFNDAESDVQEYEKAKNSIEKLAKLFDVDLANIKQTIEASIEEREKQRNSYQIEKQIKLQKMERNVREENLIMCRIP